MALSDIIKSDAIGIITHAGMTTVTVGGVTKRAIIGSKIDRKQDADFGATFGGQSLTVVIIRDDWTTLPDKGDRLTYDGTIYRITGVDDAHGAETRLLTCGSLDQ